MFPCQKEGKEGGTGGRIKLKRAQSVEGLLCKPEFSPCPGKGETDGPQWLPGRPT